MSQRRFVSVPFTFARSHFHFLIVLALSIVAITLPLPAMAKIVIDTASARATIEALTKPNLTRDQALAVADLPGNKAMIRKLNSLDATQKATRDSFADTLLEVAQGLPPTRSYGFKSARDSSATILDLLDKIERDPKNFQDWITARVQQFSPKGLNVDATGYIIVGGWADGFAFDEPKFYLNLSVFKGDLVGARLTMAHELYHAVQNTAQAKLSKTVSFGFESERYQALPKGLVRSCYAAQSFFGSMLAEGTASYVGDTELLPKDTDYSELQRERVKGIYDDMAPMRTLMEMSLAAITGAEPTSPDDVYAFNFYGRNDRGPPMYDLGYVMAKAIATRDGDAALGALIGQPPEVFVKRYIAIAADPNAKLTQLGPMAQKWAQRSMCRAR
jgi:Putative zinc dependent peptidase (DUF5700)